MHLSKRLLVSIVVVAVSACTAGQDLTRRSGSSAADASAEEEETGGSRIVDFAIPPPGVADRGRAAGVVLVEVGVGAGPRCTGALVASNVVLAPARCLARPGCQALAPESLAIRSSDERRELLGAVLEVIGPSASDFCDGAALAAVVLSTQSDGLAPFAIRARPAAAGEFVRFVGVTRELGQRTIRDHLRVERTTRRELLMGGDSCATWTGAIALDEATGELLGIGSVARLGCATETAGFVHLDAERATLERALERAAAPRTDADGGVVEAGVPRRGKVSRPTLDLGDPCESAVECAAGVCVVDPGSAAGYCSRTCGPGDRCPVGLRCERAAEEGRSACVRSS